MTFSDPYRTIIVEPVEAPVVPARDPGHAPAAPEPERFEPERVPEPEPESEPEPERVAVACRA